MSGIVGLYHLDDSPATAEPVERMADGLAHRGPDGRGVWRQGPVGLGQLLFRTTPESASAAPLVCAEAQLCLVADARIDNGAELRARLEARGLAPRTDSDAELILRSYEAWGEECPRQLLGDFAFALWDGRRRQLLAAVDHIGIRPFYYFQTAACFAFASEPSPLFAAGQLARQPNRGLMCRYLLGRFDEPEETLDESVYRLPGGHVLTLRPGFFHKRRYWDLDPRHRVRCQSDAEYAEQFLDLFQKSIAARLRSPTPVGVLLSGGLDSSSIACTARHMQKSGLVPDHGLRGYSLIFDGLPCDERNYIRDVTQRWDIDSHLHRSGPDCPWLDLDRANEFPDMSYFSTQRIIGPLLETACQRGTRVMLTGMGGDEFLLSRFIHLADLAEQGRFVRLLRQLGHCSEKSGFSWRFLWNCCISPVLPGPVRVAGRSVRSLIWKATGKDNRDPPWLNTNWAKQASVDDEEFSRQCFSPRFPTRSQQCISDHFRASWNTIVAHVANERFASRLGVELRHPFFDRRLVEFLMAVPEEQRWNGRWTKIIMRRAMLGILPESIRKRTDKAEFSSILNLSWEKERSAELDDLFGRLILEDLGLVNGEQWRLFYRGAERPLSPRNRIVCEILLWLELRCAGIRRENHEGSS